MKLISLLLSISFALSQETLVEGFVYDHLANPVEFANIYIEGSADGTVTTETGFFTFKSKKTGYKTLIVEFIGFKEEHLNIVLNGKLVNVKINLKEEINASDIVEVTASAFITDEKKIAVIARPIQVVTTPGANADIMRFFHAMPGVTQTDEGAGLFIRGGDVSESIMILDGATVLHPYRQESASGGFWGAIPPFLTKGSAFYTGSLSAKYGNVLSGVVDMESVDMVETDKYHFGAAISLLSARVNKVIIDQKLSISLSGNYSNTQTLFDLNKSSTQFSKFPLGHDLNMNLIWQISTFDRLKIFAFNAHDEISLFPKMPYPVEYKSKSDNTFIISNYQHIFQNELISNIVLAGSGFSKSDYLGSAGADTKDQLVQLKILNEKVFTGYSKLKFGTELQWLTYNYHGDWHFQPDSIVKGKKGNSYSEDKTINYQGFFMEYAYPFSVDFVIQAGLRLEHDLVQQKWYLDPRLAMSFQINEYTKIDVAAGRYHQLLATSNYVANPDLGSQESYGASLGFQFKLESAFLLKNELYYKDYSNLRKKIGADNLEKFDNSGYGYAYGNDFIFKHNGNGYEYWLSYSYLKAQRNADFFIQLSSPNFDITHTYSMVYKKNLSEQFNIGFRQSTRSGKPYRFSNNPIEFNSKRLDTYHRTDIQLSYLTKVFTSDLTIFYLAINNVFDQENVINRIYNTDYSNFTDQLSTFNRMFYFGFTTSF